MADNINRNYTEQLSLKVTFKQNYRLWEIVLLSTTDATVMIYQPL